MSKRDQKRLFEAENQRWVREELERRQRAKQAAAREKGAVAGMSPIRLPSLAEGLDEIQPESTRFAGGEW